MRWTGGDKKCIQNFNWSGRRWEENVKIDLTDICRDDVDWNHLAPDRWTR